MAIDQYSPCPCGSGKKMKFCKCVEQPQDYEKLIRLIEGGQELAAMDRINQMLAKTPNAAWLLAVKGELALGMQEIETFKDTANRFMKLKPDNPLALIMKALAGLLEQQPVEEAVGNLLQGLAESRESLPAMTLLAIELLIQSLAASNRLSMVGYWGELQQSLAGEREDQAQTVLQNPSLNLLAKVPTRIIDDPSGSPWKERLAEVVSLSKSFRFAQAETKLRAILRDFPDQAGPLSHLLRAQVAQLNQAAAFATARKLSQHLELSEEDRAYFTALAFEIEPQRRSLRTEMICRLAEIDSVDRVIEALNHLDIVEHINGDTSDQLKDYYATIVKDEIPARELYTVFDTSLRRQTEDAETAERIMASSVATIVLFGKQTDKPARAMLVAARFPKYQPIYDRILEILQMGDDLPSDALSLEASYEDFVGRAKLIVGGHEVPTIQEAGNELLNDFLNLPLCLFNGATPLEAAQEERFRGDLRGLLSHLEGEQRLIVESNVIDDIYQRLDLIRPSANLQPAGGNMRITNILDLDRLNVQELNDDHLQGVAFRAMNMAASRVLYRCSKAIRARESLANGIQAQSLALSALRMLSTTSEERLEYSQELLTVLEKADMPVGKIVIEVVGLLHSMGRSSEAQKTLLEATQSHPEDPYLLSFLQYIMQTQQRGGPGMPAGPDDLAARMLQHGTRSEAASESGLVLPGQQAGSSGESKLWLPDS